MTQSRALQLVRDFPMWESEIGQEGVITVNEWHIKELGCRHMGDSSKVTEQVKEGLYWSQAM